MRDDWDVLVTILGHQILLYVSRVPTTPPFNVTSVLSSLETVKQVLSLDASDEFKSTLDVIPSEFLFKVLRNAW